ncbi:hypothetical protein O6H91_12G005700 [Diphasiastrum complanatum]|uniref:Uncharacterized protein n=2 Tax=Diphasiastrum complanatum TaxID=34168 RepID=A0ACC2BYH3_DIPCM|nr:hypothetical protein O6H91_12G005200 [Diphasiastrum complanatum]KAJ7534828.1 hypothetical protein O6H91_12G005700 [Diphasiastrum complanatum]
MTKGRFTAKQLTELRDVFVQFDKDGDGSITALEMGSLFRSLGLTPSEEQLEAVIRKVDSNNNGLIEFSEFVSLIAPELANQVIYSHEELSSLFKTLDRDGNGFVTPVELASAMARLGHPLSTRELADMFGEADADGDGRISFAEFVSAMNSAAFENTLSNS